MNGIVNIIFSFVLLVGLLYLVYLAANLLKTKTNAIRNDERIRENELTRIGLDIAEKAIKTVVESSVGKFEELIAKDLRLKVKNGEANISELQALAGEAYSEVIQAVKPEVLQGLADSLQDVDLYIWNQIEHQLRLLKAKTNGGASGEKSG